METRSIYKILRNTLLISLLVLLGFGCSKTVKVENGPVASVDYHQHWITFNLRKGVKAEQTIRMQKVPTEFWNLTNETIDDLSKKYGEPINQYYDDEERDDLTAEFQIKNGILVVTEFVQETEDYGWQSGVSYTYHTDNLQTQDFFANEILDFLDLDKTKSTVTIRESDGDFMMFGLQGTLVKTVY